MKGIVIFSSLAIGLILGFWPAISKPKPLLWKLIVILLITTGALITLLPPLGAGPSYAMALREQGFRNEMPVIGTLESKGNDSYTISQLGQSAVTLEINGIIDGNPEKGDVLIANLLPGDEGFSHNEVVSVNPFLHFSYIPSLDERIKIMNFHVPMAWVSVLAYMVAMVFSLMYLRKRDFRYDLYASSSAALGLIFTILATVTGMLWAKFNWGSFWNWDPRQTSIFVLMLIYAAYFALRSAIDKEDLKAKLSSVYAIIAFVTVPFFVFILPRITEGLHPGSADSGSAGPLVSSKPGMLDSGLLYGFGMTMAGFTLLYFWLMNLHIRMKSAVYEIMSKRS